MTTAIVITALVVTVNNVAARPAELSFDEIIDPNDELTWAPNPIPPHELENWKGWETWEAPEKMAKLAPYYKAGYDHDGLPVYVLEYGNWNYNELAHLPNEQLEEFTKYYEQFIRRASKDGAGNNEQGIAIICDWDGFSLAHFASSKALKLALKSFTSILRFKNALKYGFQINTNFAAQSFVNIARPFLGNILEKYEIYGTTIDKWKPALLRKIPQNQLPPHYGGNKDWKPLPFV